MDALTYEHVLRRICSLQTGRKIERREDPAHLADADVYISERIIEIKAALIYGLVALDEMLSVDNREEVHSIISEIYSVDTLDEMDVQVEHIQSVLGRLIL